MHTIHLLNISWGSRRTRGYMGLCPLTTEAQLSIYTESCHICIFATVPLFASEEDILAEMWEAQEDPSTVTDVQFCPKCLKAIRWAERLLKEAIR